MEKITNNLVTVENQGVITAKDTLNSLLVRFLNELDVSPLTKKCYEKGLKRFLAFLKEKEIACPGREHILSYKNYLKETLRPSTVNLYLSAVRSFFAWLEGNRICPNIARGIKGFKTPLGYLKNELRPIQVRRLLEEINKENIVGLRDFVLINLLVRTGLRSFEIITADIGDMQNRGGEMVLYIKGKGRDEKDAFVLLLDNAYNPLMDYLRARKMPSPGEPLFIAHSNNHNGNKRLTTRSVRRIVADRLVDAGLKDDKTSCHSLRHTAGSLAIEGGANVIQVKEMLRHSNVNTTMLYIHNRNRTRFGAEKFINF